MGKYLRRKKKSRFGEDSENKAKKNFVVSGYEFYF